jgi:hypothetical protein
LSCAVVRRPEPGRIHRGRDRRGPVGVGRRPVDHEPPIRNCEAGDVLRFELGEHHRLTGLETWGVVADIWQHADDASRSDEGDIVRVADDHERV